MKSSENINQPQFAACAQPFWLLTFFIDAARRAIAGGRFQELIYSTGGHFRVDFIPLSSKLNLTSHENFRGKFSGRKNQTQIITPSKKGRIRAYNP
jgi:hypothetical protein